MHGKSKVAQKSSADLPESPMVAVKMSAAAAEQIAEACRWAMYRAEREWDDTTLSAAKRERAMLAYEWLSWGAQWMTLDAAQVEA